jgi:hypothetical protein
MEKEAGLRYLHEKYSRRFSGNEGSNYLTVSVKLRIGDTLPGC